MALAIVLAACGGEDAGTDEAAPAPDEATDGATDEPEEATDGATDEPDEATDEPAEALPDSLAVEDSTLGEILVDSQGNTAYLFTNDQQDGESACTDECAANWPAVEGDLSADEGVDQELIGSIVRDDGTTQATYNDWPLYYFIGDEAPGDVNGQGVNDVWYVVAPDGTAIESS
ncbi:MAG: hypothetical protein GEU81_02245 [Nitriliruptorales bacterium]|nr:hypothetical protein [Nitriliruptorales bacterium]